MISRVALTLASLLAIPATASAHPGHGFDPGASSVLHWLGEPEHALPLLGLAVLCAAVWGVATLSRRSS